MAQFTKLKVSALLALWLAGVAAGLFWLTDYAYHANPQAHAQTHWPADTGIQPAPDKPTLLLVGHPQCPCTRATLGELDRLLARRADKLKVQVLFYQPAGVPNDWVKTDLWQSAAAIPGISVIADWEAREARRFGASTSGEVLLYDPQGRLLFQGGITGSRGHAGDNLGRQAIETYLDTGHLPVSQTPVFGCVIWSDPLT